MLSFHCPDCSRLLETPFKPYSNISLSDRKTQSIDYFYKGLLMFFCPYVHGDRKFSLKLRRIQIMYRSKRSQHSE